VQTIFDYEDDGERLPPNTENVEVKSTQNPVPRQKEVRQVIATIEGQAVTPPNHPEVAHSTRPTHQEKSQPQPYAVELTNNSLVVHTVIENCASKPTAKCIIDTGSNRTELNRAYAAQLGLPIEPHQQCLITLGNGSKTI
jgi:hypothetical protein